MDDKLKYVVDKLNGMEYGDDLDSALSDVRDYAKENGVVIIYGDNWSAHDINGAMCCTAFIANEPYFYMDSNGVLSESDKYDRYNHAKKISVVPYADHRYSFAYETDIPHETLIVVDEDNQQHCRGIVFYKFDLAK